MPTLREISIKKFSSGKNSLLSVFSQKGIMKVEENSGDKTSPYGCATDWKMKSKIQDLEECNLRTILCISCSSTFYLSITEYIVYRL